MKIFVIDSAGMVGHAVALYLSDIGHEIIGYSEYKSDIVKTVVGSFFDTEKIESEILKGNFDAVINCSAVINNDADEDKAKATYINCFLPHFLEKITKGTKTVVVHRSTDCIFSGKKGSYTLSDTPDGESFYAQTKAIGEIVNEKDITIRTSLVGPEYEKDGNGLFNWFYNSGDTVGGYKNAIWTGLTTVEFAKEIDFLLKNKAHGLFQLVPDYAISKYELLLIFDRVFGTDKTVNAIDNKKVDKSLLPVLGGYDVLIPDYDKMIDEMSTFIKKHKTLYKNYKI